MTMPLGDSRSFMVYQISWNNQINCFVRLLIDFFLAIYHMETVGMLWKRCCNYILNSVCNNSKTNKDSSETLDI